MNFVTKTEHQSKVIPGASFVVRKLTEARRIEISMSLAEAYDKIEALRRASLPLRARVAPLLKEAQAMPKEEIAAYLQNLVATNPDFSASMNEQRKVDALEAAEIVPVYLKALLASVGGVTVDDVPLTPDTIADGPPELYAEVVAEIKREMGLTDDESGNSASPSISSAPVDGETKNTSAAHAGSAATA
jgi:hypothetical protein